MSPQSLAHEPMPYEKTPMEVVNDLRQVEAFQRDMVADAIADALFRKPALELDPRELASVRYAASLAIRRVQSVWEQAAKQQAIRKIRIALAEGELGRTLGHLPIEKQAVIAAKLAPYAIESYLGVLEDSIPQEPGTYLQIMKGGRS